MIKFLVALTVAVSIVVALILFTAKPISPLRPCCPEAASSPTSSAGQASTFGIQLSVPATNSISLASTTAPSSSYSGEPSPVTGWKILRVRRYKFQIGYPTYFLLMPGCGITNTKFPLRPGQCVANLNSVRTPYSGENQEMGVVIITVYEKDPTLPLSKWVSGFIPHLQNIPEADIYRALAKAYAHNQIGWVPDEIISHQEREEKGMALYELGALTGGGGYLSYATLLSRNGLKNVYSVELLLEFDEAAQRPSDRQYIELYKQILATLIISS